ncbi:hypothetical protein FA13DRAFT_1391801 [Coprinellus micaceus]|uniref:Uncharacterized protein n=1 Tax=Coprinellus micaceus TaxID=71717 RepID=A0A4Y7SQK9_COPMI|nr:hypothetical protein FA13DRAFT_1391801 [Coprinellus micaceus]
MKFEVRIHLMIVAERETMWLLGTEEIPGGVNLEKRWRETIASLLGLTPTLYPADGQVRAYDVTVGIVFSLKSFPASFAPSTPIYTYEHHPYSTCFYPETPRNREPQPIWYQPCVNGDWEWRRRWSVVLDRKNATMSARSFRIGVLVPRLSSITSSPSQPLCSLDL